MLLSVAKEIAPHTLGTYMDQMLSGTQGSRNKAKQIKTRFADIPKAIEEQYGEGDWELPYDMRDGAPTEWSDGFRHVRSLKYGSNDSFSHLYRMLQVVSGLKMEELPETVRNFLEESEKERRLEQEGALQHQQGGEAGASGEDE